MHTEDQTALNRWHDLFQDGPPFASSRGNQVDVYTNGDSYFEAMWQDIEQARHRIWLDFYIIEDDTVGRHTRHLLRNAARRGCEVRLLYDTLGSYRLEENFFNDLLEAGAQVVAFNHPVAVLRHHRRLWSPLHRDHRKTLIVDDHIGWTGGANIAEDYAGPRLGNDFYHDVVVRLSGPSTHSLAAVFATSWRDATGERLAVEAPARRTDGTRVRVFGFDERHGWHPLNHLVGGLLERARQRCSITTPYFIPPNWMRKAMIRAAGRGVDIRLTTSGDSDVPPARLAGRRVYAELLSAGVRIFELFGQTLHAKHMVVDGEVATIGSHNFDLWSEHHNLEVNIAVTNRAVAARLERDFDETVQHCREIEPERWQQRPVYCRPLERAAFALARL